MGGRIKNKWEFDNSQSKGTYIKTYGRDINKGLLLVAIESIVEYHDENFSTHKTAKETTKCAIVINQFLKENLEAQEITVTTSVLKNIISACSSCSALEWKEKVRFRRYYLDIIATVHVEIKRRKQETAEEDLMLPTTFKEYQSVFLAKDNFSNSCWNLYFIKESRKDGVEVLALAHYQLEFSIDKAYLTGHSATYDGPWYPRLSDKYIQIELSNEKNGRYIILNKPHNDTEYIEGFMISPTDRMILYNNSVLLTKMSDRMNFKARSIELYTDEYDKVSEDIKEYFRNVVLNRNRTYTGALYSKNELKQLLYLKNRINRPFRYDAYVSAPMSELLKDNVQRFYITQSIVEEILSWLREEELIKSFYSPITFRSKYNIATSALITDEEAISQKSTIGVHDIIYRNFTLSKYHILVMPYNVPSHALIEASWVLADFNNNIRKAIFFLDNSVDYFDCIESTQILVLKLDMRKKIDDIMTEIKQKYLKKIQIHLGKGE